MIAAVDGVIGLVMRATRIVWKVGPREKVRSEVQIQIEPSNQAEGDLVAVAVVVSTLVVGHPHASAQNLLRRSLMIRSVGDGCGLC